MILRLIPKTADLVGQTPAEWQLLEKQVRAETVDDRTRKDAERLRASRPSLAWPCGRKAWWGGNGGYGHPTA